MLMGKFYSSGNKPITIIHANFDTYVVYFYLIKLEWDTSMIYVIVSYYYIFSWDEKHYIIIKKKTISVLKLLFSVTLSNVYNDQNITIVIHFILIFLYHF